MRIELHIPLHWQRTLAVFALGIFSMLSWSCQNSAQDAANLDSLTGSDYAGKKYYFGWGVAAGGDPQSMHNEVKYDVLHTHDIFTSGAGGSYAGTKLVDQQITGSEIKDEWSKLKSSMGKDDMYVQYSSGHGFPQGLAAGVTYDDISSNVLSLPAKEVVLLIMACHSGGLVNSFNNKKSQWQNWGEQGRTLFVMSSSTVQQISQTGPGTDSKESARQQGSAGSAYGHAVWKALLGDADGYLDGVRDGFISLGELAAFVVAKTQQLGGGQLPQVTGVYNPGLIMNQVPTAGYSANFQDPAANKSLVQVQQMFQNADAEIARSVADQGQTTFIQ